MVCGLAQCGGGDDNKGWESLLGQTLVFPAQACFGDPRDAIILNPEAANQ
jgi:hypothetical protein